MVFVRDTGGKGSFAYAPLPRECITVKAGNTETLRSDPTISVSARICGGGLSRIVFNTTNRTSGPSRQPSFAKAGPAPPPPPNPDFSVPAVAALARYQSLKQATMPTSNMPEIRHMRSGSLSIAAHSSGDPSGMTSPLAAANRFDGPRSPPSKSLCPDVSPTQSAPPFARRVHTTRPRFLCEQDRGKRG